MAAAGADRDAKRSGGRLKSYPVAANTAIYKDTLVGINADGLLVPMAHGTANLKFAGVALEQGNNTGGLAGAKSVRVRRDGEFEFVFEGGGAAAGDTRKVVYALDDQTVQADAGGLDNVYPVGVIVEVESGAVVRVDVGGFIDLTQTITTANIANGAVTVDKLGNNALAASAAGRGKVANGFFDEATATSKFGADAIPESRLKPGLTGRLVDTVAADAVVGGIPVLHVIAVPDAASSVKEITLTHRSRVIDVWAVKTGANAAAANTVKLQNNADDDITDALNMNVNAGVRVGAATVNQANAIIDAGEKLKANWTKAGGNSAMTIFVLCVREPAAG